MKYEVTLHFRRTELLYDCKNAAFVIGDITSEDAEHLRHQIQDIGETGNVNRVTRILDLAIAAITEYLFPYTKMPLDGSGFNPDGYSMSTDDTLTEAAIYEIMMELPGSFSKTSVTLLEKLIHAMLVYRVLADWLTMLGSEHAGYWEDKYSEAGDEIRNALFSRCGRVRRPMTPF